MHGIQNAHLRLSVDRAGHLLSLLNRHTGREYLERPGQGLWRLICVRDDDPETPVEPGEQPAPQIHADHDRLTMRYGDLRDSAGRPLHTALTMEFEIRGDEIHCRAEVENRAGPLITELWFPLLGGLGDLGTDAANTFLLYPESAGRRIMEPHRKLADRDAQPVRGVKPLFLRDYYPGRASMQWLGLYGDQGALYLGSHDSTLQTTALQAILEVGSTPAADTLGLGFIKYPFVQAGQAWRSEPFVIAVHSGDWHHDARRYRTFADTYQDHRRPKTPWVQEMAGLHDIILLHQNGCRNFSYADVGKVCQAAAAGGLDVVKLTGWSHGGHDNMYPDFLPAERLGGEAKLRECIRAARAAGFRIVQYFHFVQMSPNSEFYRRHGEFCTMKSPQGNPFVDIFTWPGRGSLIGMNERVPLINACVSTEPWQHQVLDCTRRGLDWGSDCVFLDQTAGGPSSFLCFDARHGHPGPAHAAGPGKTQLSAQARHLVKARGPDAALGAEYMADVILQYYDFTIPFGMGFFYGGQNFGEMYRFTFPEDIVCSQYMSREDYGQLHYAFVMGHRFFLAPRQQCGLLTDLEPRFVRRLRDLVALRRRHAEALLAGQFLDATPLTGVAPGLVARAFTAGAQGAVAVWNAGMEPVPLTLAWPGRHLQVVDTPAGAVAADSAAGLRPDDVAVLLFA